LRCQISASLCFPLCSVPQGSVLGPVEFISFTEDIACSFDWLHISFQLCADDTQAHISVRPSDVSDCRQRLSACVVDVAGWCASRHLQLNASKTEIVWFGSRTNLQKIAGQNLTLTVVTEAIQPVLVARDLGVLLDPKLGMQQHIAKVASDRFFQLRRLRQLRQRIGQDMTTRLVLALVTSRLDYCNSMLAGLPASTEAPLQLVQHAAA
jgi:Reverse transcriptase (RNA-dependent DNA polymerase)